MNNVIHAFCDKPQSSDLNSNHLAALLLLRIEYQRHISFCNTQSRINHKRQNLIIHLGSLAFNVQVALCLCTLSEDLRAQM